MSNTLDQDYRTAAERRVRKPADARSGRRFTAVVVLAVFGLMIGVSALRAQHQKPLQAAERSELVAQIHLRQHRLDTQHGEFSRLESEVAGLQSTVSANRALQQRLDATVTTTAAVAGLAPVSGPGMEVTVDNAPAAGESGQEGVILDTDLQALVNALWSAGAEAIAVNGHRLTSLTAIRSAGRAITVDYRSLTPPYVIEAIGDPDTMPARLLETPGGQAWLGLRANFGIRFDTATARSLVLPGDPGTTLHEAGPAGAR